MILMKTNCHDPLHLKQEKKKKTCINSSCLKEFCLQQNKRVGRFCEELHKHGVERRMEQQRLEDHKGKG